MNNARIIYKRLLEPMKKKGYINLNHRLVNSKDDLVEIASIFRDPRLETFRIIYVKDKKIVGYESISSRMPSLVYIFKPNKYGYINQEKCVYKIKDRMKRLGADSYYLAHNHPSDNAKASNEDKRTTEYFNSKVKGFLGHLIINTNTYSWIGVDEKGLSHAENYILINSKRAEKMSRKLKQTSIFDLKISSRDDLVCILSHIKNSKDYSISILTDNVGKVRLIMDIPNHFFNMTKEQLKGFFKNLARKTGSTRVFLGTTENEVFKKAVEHQENGTFKDCICYKEEGDKMYIYEKSNIKSDVNLFDNRVCVREGIEELYDNSERKINDETNEKKKVEKTSSDRKENNNNQQKQLKVLYKKVGGPLEVKLIDDTLEAKQELVGGLIEVVPYEDALIICNEEGKLLNYPPNLVFDYDYIAGDLFVIGDDYENACFKSLTDKQIDFYKKDLAKRAFNYEEYKIFINESPSKERLYKKDEYER